MIAVHIDGNNNDIHSYNNVDINSQTQRQLKQQ